MLSAAAIKDIKLSLSCQLPALLQGASGAAKKSVTCDSDLALHLGWQSSRALAVPRTEARDLDLSTDPDSRRGIYLDKHLNGGSLPTLLTCSPSTHVPRSVGGLLIERRLVASGRAGQAQEVPGQLPP